MWCRFACVVQIISVLDSQYKFQMVTLFSGRHHRTKLLDSVSRKRDGNIKLHVSVMFPLGGNAKSSF